MTEAEFHASLCERAIPEGTGQADRLILEAGLRAAADVCHETGTWEGAVNSVLSVFRGALRAAGAFAYQELSSESDDLCDRLDRALAASESHQAARGRAVNAAQAQLACMERARDVLLRLGELDEAARVQDGIRKLVEVCRGQ